MDGLIIKNVTAGALFSISSSPSIAFASSPARSGASRPSPTSVGGRWNTRTLGAGLLIPQVIRWYWRRFKGYGYAGGVTVGMVLAVIQRIVVPELGEMWPFLAGGTGTFVASVAITVATTSWQLVLFLTIMMVMTRQWMTVTAIAGILAVLSVLLCFPWDRYLSVSKETSAGVDTATADRSDR